MDIAVVEQTSEQFLGKWKRLVSTTNWEKGQIIFEWRAALIDAGAGLSEYSDEVWSRQVGQVTPQHVGRLRRVFERFGESRDSYDGLYWSHFQAALDWDDAEMWLEGAVQNGWSIADMRRTRSETLGMPADGQSADAESDELDEDGDPADETLPAVEPSIDLVRSTERSHSGHAAAAGSSRNDHDDDDDGDDEHARLSTGEWDDKQTSGAVAVEPVRPFAHLASLPADVSEAFEAFKLCIVKHRLAGWAEIAQADMLAALNALRALALAEASG
ncbi:MAG TPA: hypothetical protein VHY91_21245 [Pirellulales bacterium]|jgi:hypothetical protein|nr:hypothetical protein [Pirellulales bacterium]